MGDLKFEGFGEIEELTRDREKGSFSRDGIIPLEKFRRLILPHSIFKLGIMKDVSIKIIDEDEYYRCCLKVKDYYWDANDELFLVIDLK